MQSKIKISVLMSVYNHDSYLRGAVKSVADQVVDDRFCVELICSDDASTDASLTTLEQIKTSSRWPDHFEMVILQAANNVGGSRNFVKSLQACTGDLMLDRAR